MTPAQLRVFAAIARHGSSREAAAELEVSEAAVSGHVSSLRKELGDELFKRTGSGISFTPGGL
ncbi:MAG: LysR family transcriptional regulator, partial [Acidimicrobiaceae bacterium]|nr:LysR family transcriptional regulator [Acidimicrobiaceae bacterium]